MRRIDDWAALPVVLVLAAAARLWFLASGVPHAVGLEEALVVDRALRILHTGEWNPHHFDSPTLVIYLHAGVDILRFLWGAVRGEWASLNAYSIAAVYHAGRLVTAAIGVATVWLTWRLARDLSSRGVALLAAAQLAVAPLHVRASHAVRIDVPAAALTTLALWLAVRASRLRTVRDYAWAGAACGFAAAAQYSGGIALVAVAAAWLLYERGAPDRGRKAAAVVAAAIVAFLFGAPFTVLDRHGFREGVAELFTRAAGASPAPAPVWSFAPLSFAWFAIAGIAGLLLVMWRPSARRTWTPIAAFALAYVVVLVSPYPRDGASTVLPLLPVLCMLASVSVAALIAACRRVPALSRPAAENALWAAALALVLIASVPETVRWLDGLKRADTRAMAAEWMRSNVPRGTRVAVETAGPANLDAAGFRIVPNDFLLERPLDWYRRRADYLVISAADLGPYRDYLAAGPIVFQAEPGTQRWGPPIRIVSLRPPPP